MRRSASFARLCSAKLRCTQFRTATPRPLFCALQGEASVCGAELGAVPFPAPLRAFPPLPSFLFGLALPPNSRSFTPDRFELLDLFVFEFDAL